MIAKTKGENSPTSKTAENVVDKLDLTQFSEEFPLNLPESNLYEIWFAIILIIFITTSSIFDVFALLNFHPDFLQADNFFMPMLTKLCPTTNSTGFCSLFIGLCFNLVLFILLAFQILYYFTYCNQNRNNGIISNEEYEEVTSSEIYDHQQEELRYEFWKGNRKSYWTKFVDFFRCFRQKCCVCCCLASSNSQYPISSEINNSFYGEYDTNFVNIAVPVDQIHNHPIPVGSYAKITQYSNSKIMPITPNQNNRNRFLPIMNTCNFDQPIYYDENYGHHRSRSRSLRSYRKKSPCRKQLERNQWSSDRRVRYVSANGNGVIKSDVMTYI